MHEGKSRGSGRGSRKTRFDGYGWVIREGDRRGSSGRTRSARLLRPRHGARLGSLDSQEADLDVRGQTRTCQALDEPETGKALSRRKWEEAVAGCGRAEAWRVESWLEARFRVPFTCQRTEPPGASSEKTSVRVWGTPRPKQGTSEMRSDASLVTLALRGIFRVPYWAPFGTSVVR
ncbi:hypothetical protein CRG98_045148 [Punica granatum]|uniref:Uncharacterized protein n=1 Tax=Punica granatum TaxID=22663 RepID=A0A2I0HRW9_PUNGR|nr:hypothetical protein CRG98_045148 [Punica granatum]